MNRTIDRIFAGLMATILLSLGAIAAAPVEKTSGNAQESSNLRQAEIVIPLGAPETDAGLSPSAPPDLDRATASSWEGETPSALPAPPDQRETPAVSQTASLYQIDWQTINLGGETSTSPSYTAFQSLGQEAIGASLGGLYSAGQGYWYGAPTGAGLCACPCHGDPNCDGTKVDVLDVVAAVGVAFRNQPSICDAGCTPTGPAERTDVDCDGDTDVLDVLKMVNVAFRNADANTEFCKPCITPPPSANCP